MYSAKELVKQLLDAPDLDVPIYIRGNEIYDLRMEIGKVAAEYDMHNDTWQIILYTGPAAQNLIYGEDDGN